MTERMLWRLEGASGATLVQPARLEQGLRLHVEHTALTTILMQIGGQQQAYISAAGCEGCAYERCVPGCYVELLRRLLRACFDACTLRYVPGGLAKRPYERVTIAWPTAAGRPLTDLSLAPWPEARLVVEWRGRHRQVTAAAMLTVGAEGPDPAVALHKAGWRAWGLPRAVGRRLANSTAPPTLLFPRAWPHAPGLLWPEEAAPVVYDRIQDKGETLICHQVVVQEEENVHGSP